ncbi:DMT family transporter [Streptomyces laculatispora]|uniref:DMT family transporter n=1 Tax=Streptomyces laculatispora TaxID=887464 RepID=A0ABY9IGS2_9ACTN|nr:DMT family transporter [Streptomyces laculatispora]WLQ45434.1 DMT family transporter [Streptomyces laculatispora]
MAVLDRIRIRSSGTAGARGARWNSGAGLLLALVATVLRSGSFVAARALHDTVPPVQAAFWRWIVAVAAVAPFAARETWRQRALIRRHLGFVALAALLGVTVYNTLVNQAGMSTSAGQMGLIMAASPVAMAVYERLGGRRLGWCRIAGTAVACTGVLLLVGNGSLAPHFAPGDLWMFAAMLSSASYSALLCHRPAEIGQLAFLLTTFVLGALMPAPAFAVGVAVQGGFEPTAGTVGPLLYAGVLSSAVAFFAWNRAVALIGASRTGIVYYLQPVCLGGVALGAGRARGRAAANVRT